jgi:hypothetical protein
MNKTSEIDKMIYNLYSDKRYGELRALARLFSPQFLNELENILNTGCRNEEFFKDVYDVSLGWIDKIPLASFIDKVKDINGNLIKSKVEIGDFLLVYTHSQTYKNKGEHVIQTFDKRAIIVQAKISQRRNPNVPIAKMNKNKVSSTSKELTLLNKWPSFDLYRNSRSKSIELEKINLNREEACAKFAGYYDKSWDCGEPDFGSTCNLTLGELFTNLIDKKTGCSFNSDNKNINDWSRLINKLMELCGYYHLPGYIFGKNKSRLINKGILYYNPFGMLFDFFSKKRFPVLVVNRIFFEGKFE